MKKEKMVKMNDNVAHGLNEKVKEHYEKAAQDRDKRLKKGAFNAYELNHLCRFRIVDCFLQQIGSVKKGIDVGTGTGVWAEVLANYCNEVIGIDFAFKNIEIARKNAVKRKLDKKLFYFIGDAQSLNDINDNSFDVATHISVLQHMLDQKKALNRINDIMQEKGKLILLVHNSRCIYNRNLNSQIRQGTLIEINDYITISEIKSLLNSVNFKILKIRLCWICINDFLTLGLKKQFLRPLMPLRKLFVNMFSIIERVFNRFEWANPLFREIVILAEKKNSPL